MRGYLFVLFFVLCSSVSATTHYVKPTGNDAAAGTSWGTAWQTVLKVNTTVVGGDTTFFGPGTYTPSHLIPASGGTANDWTAYISGNGVDNSVSFNSATLSGGDSLPSTGWTLVSGNVYSRSFTPTKSQPSQRGQALDVGVVSQSDSILKQGANPPSSAGSFYYDYTGRRLYVYCRDFGSGYNPANYAMWTGSDVPIDFSANYNGITARTRAVPAQYVLVDGFRIRNFQLSGIFLGWGDCHRCLIQHCDIANGGQYGANNGDCIGSRTTYDSTIAGHSNVIRACKIRNFTSDGGQQYGVEFYSQQNAVVESCLIGPSNSWCPMEAGIYWKGAGYGPVDSGVARYNICDGPMDEGGGVFMRGTVHRAWIYGNVFKNSGNVRAAQVCLGEVQGAGPGDRTRIYNNTFYNCGGSLTVGQYATARLQDTIEIKYNVFQSVGTADVQYLITGGNLTQTKCDSNIIYLNGPMLRGAATATTLAQWRALAPAALHDQRPVVMYNPGLAADFSRPTAPQEMNRTYGGKTWTRYGAWQPDTTITVTSPNGGESWLVSSSQDITWTSRNVSGNVRIEYSTNNGVSWTDVVASTANNGTFPWTVPTTTSTTCLVRVSQLTDGTARDQSDGVFTITLTATIAFTPPAAITDLR